MLPKEPKKILVCVSPGEDFEASLDYVVAEATRRGCGIHLALAVHPVGVGPSDVADLRLIDGEWRRYGTDFLIDCERKVTKAVGPDVAVSTEITHGPVVPTLVDVSQNAAIVVMQHRRMDRAHQVPTLSVTKEGLGRADAGGDPVGRRHQAEHGPGLAAHLDEDPHGRCAARPRRCSPPSRTGQT